MMTSSRYSPLFFLFQGACSERESCTRRRWRKKASAWSSSRNGYGTADAKRKHRRRRKRSRKCRRRNGGRIASNSWNSIIERIGNTSYEEKIAEEEEQKKALTFLLLVPIVDDEKSASGTTKSVSMDFQPSSTQSPAKAAAVSGSVSSPLAASSSNSIATVSATVFSSANGSGNVRGGSSTGAQNTTPEINVLSASNSSSSRWTSAHSPSPAADTKRSGTVSSPKSDQLPKDHPLNSLGNQSPAVVPLPSSATTVNNGEGGTKGSGRKGSISALKPPATDDHSDSSNDSDIPCKKEKESFVLVLLLILLFTIGQTLPEKEVNDDL
jgi:hypothetical protein